jgi:hypothetical protein
METRKQILTEIQEIAPFLGETDIPNLPYTVPEGYFSDFPEILMIRLKLEKENIDLPATEEMAGLSSLLAGISRSEPYRVPLGFFQSLQAKIPGQEESSEHTEIIAFPRPARVISMPMRLVRYATAACIVALIGISSYNISHSSVITDPILGLTTVSDQDMANYLDVHDVHWTPGVSSNASTATIDFNDDDIRDLLRGVPDIELEQYSASLPEQKGTVN